MTIASRVLVVDDERVFRESIRDALARLPAHCELAENGEEAVKLAEDPRIEAVVLDVRMPGASGLDVLKTLREHRPALHVIVLAEQADQELVLDALRLGASDYLAKPLHEEELRLAVERALRGTRLAAGFDLMSGRLGQLREVFAELDATARAHAVREGPGELAERAVERVGGLMGAARASLIAEEEGALRVIAMVGGDVLAADLPPADPGEGLAGLALGASDVLRIEDVEHDERCAGRIRRGRYVSGCALLAPLEVDGRPFGVLCVADPRLGRPFSEEDASLLALAAGYIGALLGRGQAPAEPAAPEPVPGPTLAELEESQRVELSREVSEAMIREVEPEAMLRAALAPIAEAFDALTSIYLADGRSGALVLEAHSAAGSRSERPTLPRDRGLTALVAQTGRLVVVERPGDDPRFDPDVDTAEDGRVGPLLCLPLTVRGKVLGVARILPAEDRPVPVRTAEVLAPALSAAVRNVLLYRSLLESIEDVARARRESGSHRSR
jgi:DNA-binding response OmpR family regulator/putative methionine-R-sulfoxide reductase with GAF domain